MPRRGRGFNQQRNRRTERSRILVVTEGEETEVQYLQGLTQFLRASGASVKGVRTKGVGRDPARVLKVAQDLMADEVADYDEAWIVVDVDSHATLATALADAKKARVPAVVSNPCFEIWLLWHYEDCAAHQGQKQLQAKLDKLGHPRKHLPPNFPYDRWVDAERRAARNPVGHSTKGGNPSSAMPDLLAALQRP